MTPSILWKLLTDYRQALEDVVNFAVWDHYAVSLLI